MRLLITLVVVAVLSWVLARSLRSHSMLFYLAAVALAGTGAYFTVAPPAVLPLRERSPSWCKRGMWPSPCSLWS